MSRSFLRLDNAALIFPAIRRRDWINVFRQSVTLQEPVDPEILQQAVDDLAPRFRSMYVRLCTGVFWYYLEQAKQPPRVQPDYAYPLTHMPASALHRCCFRVLYHHNRIAVEFFHALTDGTGAMVYLKTLTARYITLKYHVAIPPEDGVLDWRQPAPPEELEDSFQRHTGAKPLSRTESNAYRLRGTPEPDGFLHLICGVVSTRDLLDAAHRYDVTVTAFLAAVMAQVIIELQQAERRRPKPVKITIPVNLRKLFGSRTLRNFALTLNPGVDPRLGSFTLEELCRQFSLQIAQETTPQLMAARICANVKPQRSMVLRCMPVPIKNLAMRLVYARVGERKGCLNISNLGRITLPAALQPYIQRMEFIIGVQATYPNNCSVASCGDVTCINMIRNIQEPELERRFFSRLVELGIPVKIESNQI